MTTVRDEVHVSIRAAAWFVVGRPIQLLQGNVRSFRLSVCQRSASPVTSFDPVVSRALHVATCSFAVDHHVMSLALSLLSCYAVTSNSRHVVPSRSIAQHQISIFLAIATAAFFLPLL